MVLLLVYFNVQGAYAFDAFRQFIDALFGDDDAPPAAVKKNTEPPPGNVVAGQQAPVYELPDDLTPSVVGQVDNGIANAFAAAEKKAKKDPTYSLMGHLIKDNSEHFWPALISYGFNNDKFNERDLWWIIRQTSSTDPEMKEKAQVLFTTVVLHPKLAMRPQQLIWFGKLWINKSNSKTEIKDAIKAGDYSHSEIYNTYAALIENGSIVELESILQAYPESMNDILVTVACTQFDLVGKQGNPFWPDYQYKKGSYKLIPWLMRKKPNLSKPELSKSMLAKDSSPKAHYVTAALKILAAATQYGFSGHEDVVKLKKLLAEEGYLGK